jgi:hypothetical protein
MPASALYFLRQAAKGIDFTPVAFGRNAIRKFIHALARKLEPTVLAASCYRKSAMLECVL